MPGLQQGQEIVQLDQVILHRGRRQQQQKALVERVDQLPAGAGAVTQMVRLVDDDEIVLTRGQALGILAAPRRGDRGDDARLVPERVGIMAQQRVIGGGEGEAELGLQLLAPLPDQGRRRQYQRALGHAAHRVLLEYHAGLDGLAEADLVGQQHAAAELLQDLAYGLDLVPQRRDAGEMRQAEQFVEALGQSEMGEPLAQAKVVAVGLGFERGDRRQRSQIDLQVQRDIDVDTLQRWQ
jgi:hypothetical protein